MALKMCAQLTKFAFASEFTIGTRTANNMYSSIRMQNSTRLLNPTFLTNAFSLILSTFFPPSCGRPAARSVQYPARDARKGILTPCPFLNLCPLYVQIMNKVIENLLGKGEYFPNLSRANRKSPTCAGELAHRHRWEIFYL